MVFKPVSLQNTHSHNVNRQPALSYSSHALKSLRPNVVIKPPVELPREIRPRKRGKKGGVRNRLKRRGQKVPLPVVITGNPRSLNNKLDELHACVKFSEYRHASLITFTETWFNDRSTDPDVTIDGFHVVRGDRTSDSGKERAGGLCVYVNNRYCHPNNVYRTSHVCTPDVEILTVTLRPYYSPREIPKVCVIVVYVPPDGSDRAAAEAVVDAVRHQQTKSPDGAVLVTGDFNTCDVDKMLSDFKQYVDCPTREDKTLDKFYCNYKKLL